MATICFGLAGLLWCAPASGGQVYEGDVAAGVDSHASLRIGVAYVDGVPYTFTRIRIEGVPVICDAGSRTARLNLRFPPPERIPHPVISKKGRFVTVIHDFDDGSRFFLRGWIRDRVATGKLLYRDVDPELGHCRSERSTWSLEPRSR